MVEVSIFRPMLAAKMGKCFYVGALKQVSNCVDWLIGAVLGVVFGAESESELGKKGFDFPGRDG